MEWISTKDKLPPLNKYVWVYTERSKQFRAKRTQGASVYLVEGLAYIDDVTHWMPLPEPPELKEHAEKLTNGTEE